MMRIVEGESAHDDREQGQRKGPSILALQIVAQLICLRRSEYTTLCSMIYKCVKRDHNTYLRQGISCLA